MTGILATPKVAALLPQLLDGWPGADACVRTGDQGSGAQLGRATTMVAPGFPAEQGKRSRKGHPGLARS
jgi:hypothetical protein